MKKHQNVHGGAALRAISRKKKELALALCVSLWMAGGSVALAEYLFLRTTNGDQLAAFEHPDTFFYGDDAIARRPAGSEIAYNSAQKTLTITGGDWSSWGYISGGDTNNYMDNYTGGDVVGYHLTLTNVTKAKNVYGACTGTSGDAKNNWLVVSGTNAAKTEITETAVGGSSSKGNATGNHVELAHVQVSGSTSWGNIVVGGWTKNTDKEASGNFVTLTDSVTGAVLGGYADNLGTNTGGNTVTLLGGNTVNGDLLGGGNTDGGSVVTGNVLNLSGANIVNAGTGTDETFDSGTVKNFETINITGATWGTPVLTLNGAGMAQNANGTWATINTDGIAFSGVDALSAGQNTVLIKNTMTGYPAEKIVSGKYKVGTTREGTGKASISGANLIYTVAEDTVEAREQTHNTVMGAAVSMAALSMGNDFIGAATEGLSLAANTGADGVSSFAQMGGGSMRQETGSHVDTHTWNAILALGHQNKKERGTMEYGAFFEYGTGNYTTHADNGLRGDGSARYTGGGLLAKYTMKNSVYVEGSLRAGSVHDDARNVLSDGFGNPYSYDTNAAYMGFHLGVGKEITVAGGNAVDVYGKYFYNRRNGVSFDAGGHYDLDAVTSSVLRVGARYILKREKWNFYAGAAYEHEFDGKANGTADGMAIRGADTSGGSFRGELGATVKPGENSPWNIDLNVSGFAGKKQGFTGGVSVAFIF